MNGVYIREVISLERLKEAIKPFFENAGYDVSDEDYLEKVLERTRDAYDTFTEAVDKLKPFFVDELDIPSELLARLEDMKGMDILTAFAQRVSEENISTPEDVKRVAKEVQKSLGVKPKEVWHTLRIAMTGRLEGVGIDILLSTLPKERILHRIERVLKMVS